MHSNLLLRSLLLMALLLVALFIAEQPSGAFQTLTVNINQVVGLALELSLRPLKGVSYAPGVPYVDSSGALQTIIGNPTSCVTVAGGSTPCGNNAVTALPTFVDQEVPTGSLTGTNGTFNLSHTPNPATSVNLFWNGMRLSTSDFSVAGARITFSGTPLPNAGDSLIVSYRY